MFKLENIYKCFAQAQNPALEHITLQVAGGEFCVVIGNNGSGKSTLFKIITGQEQQDTGKIILDEADISNQSLIQRSKVISSVSQNISHGNVQNLSIAENIILSQMRGKKPNLQSYSHEFDGVASLVAKLNIGLENKLNTEMQRLSGGQQQMLATLMALQNNPKLLLLDEHTSALDPKTQKHLMEYTASEVESKQITTLMITHSLEDALQFGNRIIMMSHGNIILDKSGDAKQRLSKAELMELFMRKINCSIKRRKYD